MLKNSGESRERGPRNRPADLYRFSWFFYLFLAIAGAIWLGLEGGRIPPALFWDTETWWRDLGLGLAGAVLLLGLWGLARRLLPSARLLETRLAEILGPVSATEALALAFLSGTAEELFFRGAVQSVWGPLPAAALFALLHAGPGKEFRLWTLFAAVAGLVLGGLVLWSGNLLAAMVTHFLVNAVGLVRTGQRAREAETKGC
ncbi:MAG: CPBP family intramembrane metalloprotease [Acidobacteriota bacterium]|nr:CPBP family intramembrane metalloprotease [Acidobacteriota bacterium]